MAKQYKVLVNTGKADNNTVGADGSFSVPVSVADLKADADTRIEVTVQGSGGDTATAAQDYVLDTGSTPTQTALWLDPVAGDNVLSPAETAGSVTLTGKVTGPFSVGDTVTVMVNGKPYSGKPAADGRFGVAVPGSELAADPDTTIEATIKRTNLGFDQQQQHHLGQGLPRLHDRGFWQPEWRLCWQRAGGQHSRER